MTHVSVNLPAITHNPWHPTYEVSDEGRHKLQSEIAPHLRDELREMYPELDSGSVSFGGVPYAGWMRS